MVGGRDEILDEEEAEEEEVGDGGNIDVEGAVQYF